MLARGFAGGVIDDAELARDTAAAAGFGSVAEEIVRAKLRSLCEGAAIASR